MSRNHFIVTANGQAVRWPAGLRTTRRGPKTAHLFASLSIIVWQVLSTLVAAPCYGQATTAQGSTADAKPQPKAAVDSPLDPETLDGREGRELLLRKFRPEQKLRGKKTELTHAAHPVVDVHTHFHYRLRDSEQALEDYVGLMDRNRIAACISLDGKLGPQLKRHQEYLWTKYKDRFAIFANVDWQGNAPRDRPDLWPCHRPGFAEETAKLLEQAAADGVSGLKLFKRFGLGYRNPDGTLLKIDDRRWDPIWAKCGELGLPVIIHTADPAAFFDPIDETNERWEELSRHPDWSFHGPQWPSRQSLLDARNRVIARHPKTKFIGAHMANHPEDLKVVAKWLDTYPNLFIEPSSRIAELGRQPFTTRDFLIRYQDRIMFGTDGPFPETRVHYYWRFFETHDESFPYSEKVPPPQGLWNIYGIKLPDEVLQKLYYKNAAKLIPGIQARIDTWQAKHQ